jgi:AcrR family transcriptional regulator
MAAGSIPVRQNIPGAPRRPGKQDRKHRTARSRKLATHAEEDALPREHVNEIQRARILAAMTDVAAKRGAGAASVALIVARAGVSRRTFYELFDDREDCFLAAFEEAIARAAWVVLPAYRAQTRWCEQMRAGLLALLAFFEEEPLLAQLCIVQALAAGPRVLERRSEAIETIARAVDEGRSQSPTRLPDPSPLAAEAAVGAVLSVIHQRLLKDSGMPLTALLGELMSTIVLPYQGVQAAQRELRKPTPRVEPVKRPAHRDPLEGLDMRITYRTVRALIAIGATPNASNRQIATAAGITDQGQVSKLLARLRSLGLVHNDGQNHSRGTPNSWSLTPRGQEIEQTIRAQTGIPTA